MFVVYSTKKCPRCRALKRTLKKAKIMFVEKELDTNVMAELVMKNIHILSAPAIRIGNLMFEFRGNI